MIVVEVNVRPFGSVAILFIEGSQCDVFTLSIRILGIGIGHTKGRRSTSEVTPYTRIIWVDLEVSTFIYFLDGVDIVYTIS